MDTTRSPGHFHRFLRLLRTPVHFPGWGARATARRVAGGGGQSVMAPLAGAPDAARAGRPGATRSSAAAHTMPPAPPAPTLASGAMPLASAPAPLQAAVAATPGITSSRMTRSLDEVRADLARMREQARLRSEASQAQARAQARAQEQALAKLQATARARRENAYAPTDFMDLAAPEAHASNPATTSFAPTDFLDFDGKPMGMDAGSEASDAGAAEAADFAPTAFGSTAFESTAFLAPRAIDRGNLAR